VDVDGLVRPVVEASGLELVEVAFVKEQGRQVLRVMVDREGGVDLEAISRASERISRRLDLEGFEPGPYSLEVGSPGVERPLRAPQDFARHAGQQVKVKTAEPVEGVRTLSGRLAAAEDDVVRIETDAGEVTVRYEDITSARTVFDWAEDLKARPKGVKR
jgi:ribosome maturation factor RimP